MTPRQRWAVLGGAAVIGLAVAAVAVLGSSEGRSTYGKNACNSLTGNPYIEDAVIDLIAADRLRAYQNIGSDCDDRRSGSVAAAWRDVQPAAIVDVLVRDGWQRSDPPGGAPRWYTDDLPPAEPGCLRAFPGGWQQPGLAEYPTRACNAPAQSQVVLTATRGDRTFVVRINHQGMTVDVRVR